MQASCGYPLWWQHCYSGHYDLITPESYAHPAKMAPALCYRILEHLEALGFLKEGDTILDPMAGTGMTALCAGAKGLKAITVELEEKFIDFEQTNKVYLESKLRRPLDWQVIQGDSRHLSGLLAERGLVSVISPPYQAGIGDYKEKRDSFVVWIEKELAVKGYIEWQGTKYSEAEWRRLNYGRLDGRVMVGSPKMGTEGYNADNPDNIGNLKDVPLATITSPPYGIVDTSGGLNTKPPRSPKDQTGRSPNSPSQVGAKEGYGETEGQIGTFPDKPLATIMSPLYGDGDAHPSLGTVELGNWKADEQIAKRGLAKDYGDSDGQIGQLPDKPLTTITSPPYSDTEKRDRSKEESNVKERDYPRGDHNISLGYQASEDNIGVLTDKSLKSVMSPPYEDAKGDKHHSPRADALAEKKSMHETYTKRGIDNIGNKKQESYLSAMLQVYTEIARVSNVLVIVIKNPTRNGKLRRLDLDTIKILEMSGWILYCQHRALLFEELEQASLFGDTKKQAKGRLSFFKRLAWQNGQPVASWEDVLVAVRR